MNKKQKRNLALIVSCFGLWAFILLMLVSPSIVGGVINAFSLVILTLILAFILTLACVVAVSEGAKFGSVADKKPASPVILRIVASFLVAAIAIGFGSAVKSISMDPLAPGTVSKFVYENISLAAAFLSVALLYLLSFLQRHKYSFSRQHREWDERELKQRYEVIDQSYKVGLILTALFVYFCNVLAQKLPDILEINRGFVPGTLSWLGAGLLLTLAALPDVIAAWKKDKLS